MKKLLCTAAALLTVSAASLAAGNDVAMIRLANASGCTICHRIDAEGVTAAGLAPIGPSWREVADKYRGQKDAAARLTQTVLAGSSPYDSHWQGKISGLAMPPNAVAIKPADARRLVRWILALEAR